MRLLFSFIYIFTFCITTTAFSAALPNSGLDWSNYNGLFSNPVTPPGEKRFADATSGSLIIPTSIEIELVPLSLNSVGSIGANGGPEAKQTDNGIPLNSIFFKPNNSGGSNLTADYTVIVRGEGGGALPTGNPIYLFSIAQREGTKTSVELSAYDTFDTLVTTFTSMEIEVDGTTFTATSDLTAPGAGYTTIVTNSDNTGTTNTQPLALYFGVDISRVEMVISAIDVNGSGNYDGFNFGAAIVPEPSTYLLMGSALAGVLFLAKRRKARLQ